MRRSRRNCSGKIRGRKKIFRSLKEKTVQMKTPRRRMESCRTVNILENVILFSDSKLSAGFEEAGGFKIRRTGE